MTNIELRNKLNILKDKHGMTNQQIADISGVSIGTVSGIMSGQTEKPGFEPVCAILIAMDESIDAFFGIAPSGSEHPIKADPCAMPPYASIHGEFSAIAKSAIAEAYTSNAISTLHSQLKWWRGICLVLVLLVALWFTWDVTHPTMGFIQYEVSAETQNTTSTDRIDIC